MNKYALIFNGRVHNLILSDTAPNLPPTPTGENLLEVDVTDVDGIQENWIYDSESGTFSAPPTSSQPTEEQLKQNYNLLVGQKILSQYSPGKEQSIKTDALLALILSQPLPTEWAEFAAARDKAKADAKREVYGS